jgi:hypothetical protein
MQETCAQASRVMLNINLATRDIVTSLDNIAVVRAPISNCWEIISPEQLARVASGVL